MILTLIDLAIATVSLAGKGVYSSVKYTYDWYYDIKEEEEPNVKDLQKEIHKLEEKIDSLIKK